VLDGVILHTTHSTELSQPVTTTMATPDVTPASASSSLLKGIKEFQYLIPSAHLRIPFPQDWLVVSYHSPICLIAGTPSPQMTPKWAKVHGGFTESQHGRGWKGPLWVQPSCRSRVTYSSTWGFVRGFRLQTSTQSWIIFSLDFSFLLGELAQYLITFSLDLFFFLGELSQHLITSSRGLPGGIPPPPHGSRGLAFPLSHLPRCLYSHTHAPLVRGPRPHGQWDPHYTRVHTRFARGLLSPVDVSVLMRPGVFVRLLVHKNYGVLQVLLLNYHNLEGSWVQDLVMAPSSTGLSWIGHPLPHRGPRQGPGSSHGTKLV